MGELKEPEAKVISKNLYELRVRYKGQWRCFYPYYLKNQIVLLRFFNKKTQKAPRKEINLAIKRYRKL